MNRPPAQCVPFIHRSRPVKGDKERLCESDEARVSLLRSPKKYAGMVERLQEPGPSRQPMEMSFSLTLTRNPSEGTYDIPPAFPASFILRFLAMRLARSIHPDNFINPREMRISAGKGGILAAMYSDFVPDETGVIGRRTEFSRMFYSVDTREEQMRVRKVADHAEHASNPALENCLRMMELSGIYIPHPEANYHVADGKTVFFEVTGIDARKAFFAAMHFAPDPAESLALLSTMTAVMFRHYRALNQRWSGLADRQFRPIDFPEEAAVVLGLLRHAQAEVEAGARERDARLWVFEDIKSAMTYAYGMACNAEWISRVPMEPTGGWPVRIGEGIPGFPWSI